MKVVTTVVVFLLFVVLLGRAFDQEFASAGGVLEERGESVTAGQVDTRQVAATPRSSSACGASSIGPDGRVTVTVCGEGLSERAAGERTPLGKQSTAARGNSHPARSESLYQGKQASIRAIRKVFGRRAAPAIRVASCETGGTFDARAVGRAGERGLFQIHPIHFSWAQPARLFDPVWNSRVAYRLSRGGTRWGPWSCRWAA